MRATPSPDRRRPPYVSHIRRTVLSPTLHFIPDPLPPLRELVGIATPVYRLVNFDANGPKFRLVVATARGTMP